MTKDEDTPLMTPDQVLSADPPGSIKRSNKLRIQHLRKLSKQRKLNETETLDPIT